MQPLSPPADRSAVGFNLCASPLNQIRDYAQFSKAEIISMLEQTYGQRLAEEVVKQCDTLGDQVSGSKVKELLVAVAALVTKQDLLETFSEIIGSLPTQRRCVSWLSSSQIEKIRSKRSFQELGNEELISLRNLFCQTPDGKGIAEELFPQTKGTKATAFGRHLKMVQACELSEHYIQSAEGDHYDLRRQMAGEEHLARVISYNLPDQNAINLIVPILNEEGETILAEVRGVFEDRGLHFFVFLPLTEGQWKQQADTPCPVWYAFRGTNDNAAWQRNLFEGTIEAGRYSYARHEPKILECFLSCTPQGPYKLIGTGHSLAGAESARMVRTLFTYAARGLQGNPGDLEQGALKALTNLRGLKLVTWNPACLAWDTIASYNEARKLFKDLSVDIRHNYVDEDFVTVCGRYLLGYRYHADDVDDQPQLTKFILRDMTTSVGATLPAHTTPLLPDNARAVEKILPIPQDQVNYKLGPRGIGSQVYAIGAGVGKNVWRFPKATYYSIAWTLYLPVGATYYLARSVNGLWQTRTVQAVSASEANPVETVSQQEAGAACSQQSPSS